MRGPGARRALATVGLAVVLASCAGTPRTAAPAAAPPAAGVTLTAQASPTGSVPAGSAPARPEASRPSAADGGSAAPAPSAAVVPVRVRIPSIGVDSSLESLRLDGEGVLAPPRDPDRAGWHVDGVVPGEQGPAVVAGHVDSEAGPAVFARLGRLSEGDEVQVRRSDGSTVRFRVVGRDQYAKDAFPTDEVYGPTPDRALRLITCGGTYDRGGVGYRDNVVVYAVAA